MKTPISRLRAWLNDLPIPDPVDRRMATLLQVILIGFIAVIVIASVLIMMVPPVISGQVILVRSFVFILIIGIPLALLRRGYFRGSTLIIIAIFFLLETFAVTRASLREIAETLSFFTLAIILAGLLVSRRALALTFVLSAAVVGFGALREQSAGVEGDSIAIAINFVLLNGLMSVFLDRFGITLRAVLNTAENRAQALRGSERRFRALVEHGADQISLLAPDGSLLYENPTALRPLGYAPGTFLGRNLFELVHPDDLDRARQTWEEVLGNPSVSQQTAFRLRHADGSWRWMEGIATNLLSEPAVQGIVINYRDVTDRKQAEDALRKSEEHFRTIIELTTDAFSLINAGGTIVYSSPSINRVLGYVAQERVGHSAEELIHPDDLPAAHDAFQGILEKPSQSVSYEMRLRHKDGRWLWFVSTITNLLAHPAVGAIVSRARDITERKRAEDAVRENEELYRSIFDGVQDAIFVESNDGKILAVNDRACEIYGYSRAEFLTKTVADIVPEGHAIMTFDSEELSLSSRPVETFNRRANGEVFPIEISGRLQTIHDEEVLLVVVRDITERKQAEKAEHRRANEFASLYETSRDLATKKDLYSLLEAIVVQTTQLLNSSGGGIYLYEAARRELEIVVSRGTTMRPGTRLQLGEGMAGRVAQTHEPLIVDDYQTWEGRSPQFAGEPVSAVLEVPMLHGGELLGVLIAEQSRESERKFTEYDAQLLSLFAAQAAIAIDNAQLLERLQHSNLDLSLAYDATIEGWSWAMDLRDKETEGHTRRVTELTLSMARSMGLKEEEMTHIRRGGLLHDIGKLGVPDNILLKPNELTDEEWKIMRKHPTYAYEMLSSITYLKPALDIPYCHHEKWDGKGYPRGLKGEQIPLVARIFAIVDVWDAVTSDRPYRPAWTKVKALKYIKEQSGKYFDPQVVKAFLRLIADQ